jgi:hypothetical protein
MTEWRRPRSMRDVVDVLDLPFPAPTADVADPRVESRSTCLRLVLPGPDHALHRPQAPPTISGFLEVPVCLLASFSPRTITPRPTADEASQASLPACSARGSHRALRCPARQGETLLKGLEVCPLRQQRPANFEMGTTNEKGSRLDAVTRSDYWRGRSEQSGDPTGSGRDSNPRPVRPDCADRSSRHPLRSRDSRCMSGFCGALLPALGQRRLAASETLLDAPAAKGHGLSSLPSVPRYVSERDALRRWYDPRSIDRWIRSEGCIPSRA